MTYVVIIDRFNEDVFYTSDYVITTGAPKVFLLSMNSAICILGVF